MNRELSYSKKQSSHDPLAHIGNHVEVSKTSLVSRWIISVAFENGKKPNFSLVVLDQKTTDQSFLFDVYSAGQSEVLLSVLLILGQSPRTNVTRECAICIYVFEVVLTVQQNLLVSTLQFLLFILVRNRESKQ